MIQQVEALHIKQQDIGRFIDGVPETVGALREKLDSISKWCSDSHLDAVPVIGKPLGKRMFHGVLYLHT